MSILSDKPWHEVQDVPTTDGQCGAWFHSWLFGTERCENPATVVVRNACVHEHVAEVPQCQRCTDRMSDKPMYCNACTDGPDSHECPVRITVAEIGS